jgi:hypothetical protein
VACNSKPIANQGRNAFTRPDLVYLPSDLGTVPQ